jgi:cytoskeletal protein CcmA (bactofilin family)
LPKGGVVSEGAAPSGLGNTIAITPSGGSDANQQLLVYPTGNIVEGNHLHLTTGDLYNTELYLGNDNLYVKLANTGNVVINSNDGVGNAGQWTFGTDGNLTFPRDAAGNTDPILTIVGGANPGITSTDVSLAGPANLSIVSDYAKFSGFSGTEFFIYADDGELGGNGNVVLSTNNSNVGNTYNWTFGTDGILTLPDTTTITAAAEITLVANSGGNISGLLVNGDADANLYAHTNVVIYANSSGPGNTWTFDTAGNITFPNGAVFTGYDLYAAANSYVELAGSTGNTYMGVGNDGVFIQTDWNGAQRQWSFSETGNLTLPAGGNLIVSSGNITAGNVSVTGNVSATNIVAEGAFSIQTANFNAVIGGRYGVNTTGGAVAATLPSSPATGGAVFFADAGGAYSSNNLIINPNGATIMGSSGNMTVSTDNQSVGLFYNGATWRIYNAG